MADRRIMNTILSEIVRDNDFKKACEYIRRFTYSYKAREACMIAIIEALKFGERKIEFIRKLVEYFDCICYPSDEDEVIEAVSVCENWKAFYMLVNKGFFDNSFEEEDAFVNKHIKRELMKKKKMAFREEQKKRIEKKIEEEIERSKDEDLETRLGY